jgi:hypothetical protein
MGFPICESKCPICAVADMYCLAGNGDDDYSPATKEQVIKRLDEDKFNSKRDMMIKYLKDKFNYDYDSPRVESKKTPHVEIDEEEYAKHHTNNIKSSPAVNSFTSDQTLDNFIDLTSDDGLFTLELNAAEADCKKKNEYKCTTLALTTIRMSDFSDKEIFLNYIKNILSWQFPKATEEIFDKYYDAIPREEDLTTKISNILREAGVDESKISDTAIALIDTILNEDEEDS